MYEQSLFVRMQMNHPDDIHLLSIQYRMHPEISRFPSQQFYDSELRDGLNMEILRKRIWHNSTLFGPYRFFDIQGKETSMKGHSLVNHQEVSMAITLYRRLVTDFREQDFGGMIGIITPYKQQLGELKRRFRLEFGGDILDTVDFNTTDAFQGREREIIIFSCVRASPSGGVGFLSDIRRMNVGLTRAKSSLFILGNAQSLLRNEFWGKLVRDAKGRGIFTDGNIQAMLNKTTRIDDPAKSAVILPMAMDIDEPDLHVQPGSVVPTLGAQHVQEIQVPAESRARNPLPGSDRNRPSATDAGSRKQQATRQSNIHNTGEHMGARTGNVPVPVSETRKTDPPTQNALARPLPSLTMRPASLLPPQNSRPDLGDVDPREFCFRCGRLGHRKPACTEPANPARVDHMKKFGRGDPHDRAVPPVQ